VYKFEVLVPRVRFWVAEGLIYMRNSLLSHVLEELYFNTKHQLRLFKYTVILTSHVTYLNNTYE
jgi:hypothetical protein